MSFFFGNDFKRVIKVRRHSGVVLERLLKYDGTAVLSRNGC